MAIHSFQDPEVENKFSTYPEKFQKKFLILRDLIFQTAARTKGVGELTETLRWGEPAYVTAQTKSGTPIRIDWKKKFPNQIALYFNCNTTLVKAFRLKFKGLFSFEGNRSIRFQEGERIPKKELSECFQMALTYHLNKKIL